MAEIGDPLRIKRDHFTHLGGEGLWVRSSKGHAIGGITLGKIIDDDNLSYSLVHEILPVVSRTEKEIFVPTWRVAETLAKRAEVSRDDTLAWEAMRLGADPDAALVVPAERIATYEML